MATSRILVTGAAGFIGANLSERLVAEGYDVIGVDNLSYGSLGNLARVSAAPNFRLVRADIRDRDALARWVPDVDQIVHLAAFKIPRYSDTLDTLLVNGLGSNVIFELAVRSGIRVIAASTADVYGKNPDVPFAESDDLVLGNTHVNRWAYAVSKLFEEYLLLAYHERHNLPMALIRFFGGYGPHMNLTWWGGPIAVFLKAALARTPLPVHGDGTQTRCFTYISDYVDPIVALLERPEIDGEVFNIGTTDEIAMADLARQIWSLVNDDEPQLHFIPYESFGKYEDCKRRQPDIAKARRLLDYRPQVSLADGLGRTLTWLRRRLGEPEAGVPAARRRLFCLIPVYNESGNVDRLLQRLTGAGEGLGLPLQFVFVDDGSTDDTVARLRQAAERYPLTVLEHGGNRGVGAAFNTGFTHLFEQLAASDLVVTLEGDNTSDPDVLQTMVRRIDEGADVVLASCYHHRGGIANVVWWRVLLSHLANGLTKVVFRLSAIATLSSFYRVYQGAALHRLRAAYGDPILASRGFECMIELLAKLNYCGLTIEEVPMVLDGSRRVGKSKMRVVRTGLGYLRLFAKRYLTRAFRPRPVA